MANPTRPLIPSQQTTGSSTMDAVSGSNRDPVATLAEILANKKLTTNQKNELIEFHNNRFKNRRRMAYYCLYALLVFFLVLIIGVFVDGFYLCDDNAAGTTCREGILKTIQDNQQIILWLSGFLTSIVGAYFGVTALRPSS